jgi:magnesium chelatase family protein
MLIAATNPCPCGYAGQGERCGCSDTDVARHRRRLSGPLLDRLDLLVNLELEHAGTDAVAAPTSLRAREQVLLARERQAARARMDGARLNAHLDAGALRRHARLDAPGLELLRRAGAAGLLSARGEMRVLRVARTIADLDGSARVRTRHLGSALGLRADPVPARRRAA